LNFNHVLFIGPQNEKGGIGAVLETYRTEMNGFSMISTYPSDAMVNKPFYFLKQIARIFKLLITDADVNILHIHCASRGSFMRKALVVFLAKGTFPVVKSIPADAPVLDPTALKSPP